MAAACSGKLSTSRPRLASSGTDRPTDRRRSLEAGPCLQRCSSEHGPYDARTTPATAAEVRYRSCAVMDSAGRTLAPPGHLPPVGPLWRQDIFYSGSVVSLGGSSPPLRPGLLAVTDSVKSVTSLGSVPPVRRDNGRLLVSMLDVSLLRSGAFCVVCAASAFIQLGYFVPIVFMTPYARTLGLSTSDAAILLSVIGTRSSTSTSSLNELELYFNARVLERRIFIFQQIFIYFYLIFLFDFCINLKIIYNVQIVTTISS